MNIAESPEQEFQVWLRAVNRLCIGKYGLRLQDFPDIDTRTAYDAGTSAQAFFDDYVQPAVRAEFGPIVDDIP